MPAAQSPHLHQGQPVLTGGVPLAQARAALVLIHGRGASAEDILQLGEQVGLPGWALLAPQAAGNTWYPYSFLSPIAQNEPWLTSALRAIQGVLDHLAQHGLPAGRTVLLGFSQGACLALEFAARHARRYGGLIGLSGGLIGPPGTPRQYPASLAGTPVFLGCSDVDPHIPAWRVEESAQVLSALGGLVDARLYPGMGHTVNPDELQAVQRILQALPA
jgi:predicted esterase